MPISAVDSISPAFQHAKQQLLQPFRAGQWARLALVGLLAGELSSGGGCHGNFQMPTRSGGGVQHLLSRLSLPNVNPALYAGMIVLLLFAGLVLWLLFIYVNSVFRFILFDSVVAKHCEIRRSWTGRQAHGWRYFIWQILLMMVVVMGLTILVGIPAAIGFALGWLKEPSQHPVPLILGGIVLFFALLCFFVMMLTVIVLTKDFVIPQMALEDLSAMESWRRLWPMLKTEKGGYAGYIGMKVVMALGAAVVIGIVATIVIFILLIPAGGFGAIAVLAGKAAGLKWDVYTITLAIVVGSILLAVIIYAVALVSVPAVVFFPAYSLYFFAARYPALDAILHPLPPSTLPTVPEIPPEPPPFPANA